MSFLGPMKEAVQTDKPLRRASRAAARSVATESEDMIALAAWLDQKRLLWCHVPNGGWRPPATAARLKLEGLKPGVPDILIFTPPNAFDAKGYSYLGVALELKRAKGGRLSAEQARWLDALQNLGWYTVLAIGLDDALGALSSLY